MLVFAGHLLCAWHCFKDFTCITHLLHLAPGIRFLRVQAGSEMAYMTGRRSKDWPLPYPSPVLLGPEPPSWGQGCTFLRLLKPPYLPPCPSA